MKNLFGWVSATGILLLIYFIPLLLLLGAVSLVPGSSLTLPVDSPGSWVLLFLLFPVAWWACEFIGKLAASQIVVWMFGGRLAGLRTNDGGDSRLVEWIASAIETILTAILLSYLVDPNWLAVVFAIVLGIIGLLIGYATRKAKNRNYTR